MSQTQLKNGVRVKTSEAAFKYLCDKKEQQEKIRHLEFSKLEMQQFLCSESIKTTKLSKLTHNLLAHTIDIKEHNPWKYADNLCICEESAETQVHIFFCQKLESENDLI